MLKVFIVRRHRHYSISPNAASSPPSLSDPPIQTKVSYITHLLGAKDDIRRERACEKFTLARLLCRVFNASTRCIHQVRVL